MNFENRTDMKNLLHAIILVLAFSGMSQQDTILHHHKFPNGKTSTIAVLKDNREGYAKAYNHEGIEIYHSHIRRFGGHASVSFKHHDNGMVKEAHYSSHPDGGIQWYRSWTYFDENGIKTGELHDNWEDRVTVMPTRVVRDSTANPSQPRETPMQPRPTPQKKVDSVPDIPHPLTLNPQPKKTETVMCADIHKNTTAFVNHSNRRIILNINHAGKDTLVILKPRKTLAGPSYISAQISSPMQHNVHFKFSCAKKKCVIDAVNEVVKLGELETLHRVHFYARKKR
jgi:hypothetical protein